VRVQYRHTGGTSYPVALIGVALCPLPFALCPLPFASRHLHTVGLESFVKTTGGRGLHVVVPVRPRLDWSGCLGFARAFAQALVRRQPELFTEKFAKAGRERKILVDYLRNNRTNTSIAAYSTRAKPNANVSTPIAWSELSVARPPDRFTMHTMPERLRAARADPWRDYHNCAQQIPRGALEAFARL